MRNKKPFIHRKNGELYFGYSSFKWTILPFILTILLIAILTYLNGKYFQYYKAVPCQQIQSQQTEQTKSGFI